MLSASRASLSHLVHMSSLLIGRDAVYTMQTVQYPADSMNN